jgi:DNA mismatch repair protein MutL
MGHIADRVASIALGHPGVQFRLTHNGNIVKDWPSTSTPLDRVVNVLGSDLKNNLLSIEFQNNAVSISGWISSPRMTRRTSRGLFIYVNGRFVRDRSVQHALFEGYSQRLVKGQFPIAALFINVPFEEVDVNVHPTKSEVRFARQRDIHEAVKQAVAKTLFAADKTGWDTRKNSTEEAFRPPGQVSEKAQRDWGFGIGDFELKKSEVKSQFYSDSSNGDKHHGIPDEHDAQPATRNPQPATRNAQPATRNPQPATRNPQPATRNPQPATRNPQPATRNAQPTPRLTQTTIWQKKRFGDMRIIGQLHNTYIIGEADEGLILIDQHAAHERILFEQFSDRATNSPKAAQRLLVPESVELGYREAKALEKLIPNLAELGLDIEPFGGNTFVIKSVPPLLAQREVKPLLVEIVEKIVEIGSSTGLAELLDECRMVMACHGAIRANQALSDKQISGLMTQLDECHNPSHCPHGRPTWIRWDIRTLEKSFKRVV